jgi:TRAP-type C4-dicarboxylate transport system permease small subunit
MTHNEINAAMALISMLSLIFCILMGIWCHKLLKTNRALEDEILELTRGWHEM